MTQLAAEPSVTVDVEADEVLGTDREGSALLARVGRPLAALRGVPHLGTWAGVVVSAAGLVLIAVAWGRTAGLVNVGLQTPYVVSAGFTGLGLVVVGLTLVSIAAKRADAQERTRQLRELREVLADLRRTVEDQQAVGKRR
ncbi:MAG TPA: hypothetical protein VMZ11_05930 [Mycobacteriales bacterium]|nr:hypothetical protein [Mycobacteriales bacterium]